MLPVTQTGLAWVAVTITEPVTYTELVLEAVRQVRGTSTRLAQRHDVSLVIGAPLVAPASNLLLGSRKML